MAELLRRLGCAVDHDAPRGDGRRSTSRRSSTTAPTTTSSVGCAPRSTCSARWSPAAARPRSPCPAATPSAREPLDFHVAGLARMGALVDSEHGFIVASAPDGLDRSARSVSTSPASVPPRTSSWRRCSPGAPRSSTTPRASRRSSTSAGCSSDGRAHRRDRHVHPGDPGRRAADPGGARDGAGPDRSPGPGPSPL